MANFPYGQNRYGTVQTNVVPETKSTVIVEKKEKDNMHENTLMGKEMKDCIEKIINCNLSNEIFNQKGFIITQDMQLRGFARWHLFLQKREECFINDILKFMNDTYDVSICPDYSYAIESSKYSFNTLSEHLESWIEKCISFLEEVAMGINVVKDHSSYGYIYKKLINLYSDTEEELMRVKIVHSVLKNVDYDKIVIREISEKIHIRLEKHNDMDFTIA